MPQITTNAPSSALSSLGGHGAACAGMRWDGDERVLGWQHPVDKEHPATHLAQLSAVPRRYRTLPFLFPFPLVSRWGLSVCFSPC